LCRCTRSPKFPQSRDENILKVTSSIITFKMKENPSLKKERFELGNSYSSIDKDEIENEYDYERKINYPNFTTSNGLFFILMGTVVSALGNR